MELVKSVVRSVNKANGWWVSWEGGRGGVGGGWWLNEMRIGVEIASFYDLVM